MANFTDVLQAASGPIGAVVGGIFGSYQQKKANEYNQQQLKTQFQYNKQLQDEAYALNLQQWNRENEYNSPTQVMQRLRDAGLNPHLAYQSLNGGATAATSPKYQAPEMGSMPSALPDIMGNISAGQAMAEQVSTFVQRLSNLKSQGDLTRANTAKALADAAVKSNDAQIKKIALKYADGIQQGTLAKLNTEIEKNQAQKQLMISQYGVNMKQADLIEWNTNLAILKHHFQYNENQYQLETYEQRKQNYRYLVLSSYEKLQNLIKDGRLKDITYDKIEAAIRKDNALSENLERSRGYTGEAGNFIRLLYDLVEADNANRGPSSGVTLYDEDGRPVAPIK